jgi:hypothetical protein
VFLSPCPASPWKLDYVMRDAYMCGVAIGAVDIDRLMYYTFFSEKGLTLHKSGLTALNMFLNARLYMYTNVYYHRTTRAIDEHLKERPRTPWRQRSRIPDKRYLEPPTVLSRPCGSGAQRGWVHGGAREGVGGHPLPRGEVEDGL